MSIYKFKIWCPDLPVHYKCFSTFLCIIVVAVVCCGGCGGIKRIEKEEGVLYQDTKTKDIIIYYWDQDKDGSLQKTAITTRKDSWFKRDALNDVVITDINGVRGYLSVDSLRARQYQDAYNDIRSSFAATKDKTYPENQIQSRPEIVRQLGLWLREYHNNASAPESSDTNIADIKNSSVQKFHTYLAFRGMKYWYNQLNWLEKLSVFEDPEATGILKLEFMEQWSGVPIRTQFEDSIKSLSEDMDIAANRLQAFVDGNVEDYKYRKSCEAKGLKLDSFN